MKKKLLLFILILLIPVVAWASGRVVFMAPGTSELTCSKETQQAPTDAVTSAGIDGFALNQYNVYVATQFTYTGTTGTLCCVSVYHAKIGSPTGNVTLYLYSNNATPDPDEPDESLGDIGVLDSSTFEGQAWHDYEGGTGASITNGQTYWLVWYKAAYDGSNYPSIGLDNDAATTVTARGEDGSTWYEGYDNYTFMFKLYILE